MITFSLQYVFKIFIGKASQDKQCGSYIFFRHIFALQEAVAYL